MMTIVCLAFLFMMSPNGAALPAPMTAKFSQAQVDRDYAEGRRALSAGDYQTAVASLSRYAERVPYDFNAHYYLGLSFRGAKQYDKAIAAFERGTKLDPKRNVARYEIGVTYLEMKDYDAALKQLHALREKDPQLADLFHDLLPQEMIEQYRLPPSPTAQILAKKSAGNEEILQVKADLRPAILDKEKASYTELARMNRTVGTVVLGLVFNKDGEITDLRVIRALPDGLTLSALKAAQKIRFTPAKKDGQPISLRGNVEYNFTLY